MRLRLDQLSMAFSEILGLVQGFDQNWAISHTVHVSCSDDHIRFLESILWSGDQDFIQQRLGLAIPIDLIQAKPNDVLSNRGIGRDNP